MVRNIILILFAVAATGAMVIRLAANKSKINQETSYRDSIANVAVSIRIAKTAKRNNEINFVGHFNPSKETALSSELPGKLVSTAVDEGDYVTKGQVIAELDHSALLLKKEADEAQYEHSTDDLARYENLSKSEATTDATLKQMRLTHTLNGIAVRNDEDQIAKSSIRASITGYLTAKNFEVGMMLSPGIPIGQIANTTVLKFTVLVPEYQVVKFKPGQKVRVSADVFPDTQFSGTVSQISEKGDENHQYKIEVLITNHNKQHPLKAGMNGTMSIESREPLTGIFIPGEAVIGSTENPMIYIAAGNRAVQRKIKEGITIGNEIQILGGIHEGDTVIIAGMNNLRDSATIKIIR